MLAKQLFVEGRLFYLSRDGSKIFAAATGNNGATFEAGTASGLFAERFGSNNVGGGHPYSNYAVSADGQRFLVARSIARDTDSGPEPIVVVTNWAAGLKK